FIVFEEIDEFGRVCLEEKQELFTNNPNELNFVIAPGMKCNYKCKYCFQKNLDLTGVMTPEIAVDTAEYICKQLQSRPSVRKLNITWFGGEPLLFVDIIEIISRKLIKYTEQNGIGYYSIINTNGRLLDENTLTAIRDCCVNVAQITLDGTRNIYCENKGVTPKDFDCVIDNIKHSAEIIKIFIRLNIPNNEANEAITITDYLFTECNLLGKIGIHFSFVRDHSLPNESAQQAYVNYIDNYFLWANHVIEHYGKSHFFGEWPKRVSMNCSRVKTSNGCIGSHGELFRCLHDFGNVSKKIGDIWNGKYYNETDFSYYTTIDTPQRHKCSQCKYLPIHMGECKDFSLIGYSGFDCESYAKLKFKLKLFKAGIYDKLI
ncbi:MAG: radical SAM protein, partial [Clostridiales bacterium]|nr:radical SAM protein [Clostridiales bacterium]